MRLLLLALLALFGLSQPVDEAIGAFTVVDGDTVVTASERIRIANIDAPETRGAACEAEARLGRLTAERLRALLSQGTPIVRREGEDRHGRTLARISVNGRDVGETLVREGLARSWDGRRRPWC